LPGALAAVAPAARARAPDLERLPLAGR